MCSSDLQEVDMAAGSSSAVPTWKEKSRFSTRRELAGVSDIPTKKLLLATTMSARKEGKKDLTALLKHASISPARPAKILKSYKTVGDGRPYTPEEALAQLLDEGLPRSNYENIRRRNISLGWKINPPYSKLLKAKERCRPPSTCLKVSELTAEVSLQELLEHTAVRLVELQEEVIQQQHSNAGVTSSTATLICTWGFDGSSSQSNYKQRFVDEEENADDSSMFATTIVPMQLVSPEGYSLWNNRTPQSVRFCRPLHLR